MRIITQVFTAALTMLVSAAHAQTGKPRAVVQRVLASSAQQHAGLPYATAGTLAGTLFEDGRVGFFAYVVADDKLLTTLWLADATTTTPVFDPEHTVEGPLGTIALHDLSSDQISISPTGQIVLQATIDDPDATTDNNQIVVLLESGIATMVLRAGDPVPGGVISRGLLSIFDDLGRLFISAHVEDPITGERLPQQILTDSGVRFGPLVNILPEEGTPSPDGNGVIRAPLNNRISISDAGVATVQVRVLGMPPIPTDSAMWIGNGTIGSFVARTGDPLPDASGLFFSSAANYVLLNSRGDAVTRMLYRIPGTGSNIAGLYYKPCDGMLVTLAQLNQPIGNIDATLARAPFDAFLAEDGTAYLVGDVVLKGDTPASTKQSLLAFDGTHLSCVFKRDDAVPGSNDTFWSFRQVTANSLGDVMFTCEISPGGDVQSNVPALYIRHHDGGITEIARSGDFLDGASLSQFVDGDANAENYAINDSLDFIYVAKAAPGTAFLVRGTLIEVCIADTNSDGDLTPADFNAWVSAFNSNAPECDQNGDSLCLPTDFSAWIQNYNQGCP